MESEALEGLWVVLLEVVCSGLFTRLLALLAEVLCLWLVLTAHSLEDMDLALEGWLPLVTVGRAVSPLLEA